MKDKRFSRRSFLHRTLTIAAGAPLAFEFTRRDLLAASAEALIGPASPSRKSEAKVAIVGCRTYGPEVKEAMAKCFDLLGGIGSLVNNKTVTIKVNLTGTNFSPFLGRPVGETYMT